MSLKRNRLALAALLAIAAACGGSQEGNDEGRVTLLLTDAAGDFKAAVVTIDRIYLQGEGGEVVLREEKFTTNLLTLANDTAELVKDKAVPAGKYSELRFVISGGYVEVEKEGGATEIYASSRDYEGLPDGAQVSGDLQMPSFAQSGLKVKLPGEGLDIEGEQVILLVDFDVAQSFGKQAGQSGKWVMHPVVKATRAEASGTAIAQVKLGENVTLPAGRTLADFSAVLKNAEGSEEKLAFTDENADGTFEARFKFLIPGAFTVSVAPPEGVTAETEPAGAANVTIESGKEATVTFTVKSATATPD